MTNYTKYICLFLMLIGINVSAWGGEVYVYPNSYGTASLSSSGTTYSTGATVTFTVTPNSGYYCPASWDGYYGIQGMDDSYNDLPGLACIGYNTFSFTMPSTNAYLWVNFKATTSHSITYHIPSCVSSPDGTYTDNRFRTPATSSDLSAYKFEGWITTSYNSTTKPTIIYPASAYIPDDVDEVYALYSSINSAFSKTSTLTNGADYMLFMTDNASSTAADRKAVSTVNTTKKRLEGTDISVTSSATTCTDWNCIWTFEQGTGDYSSYWFIYSKKSGKYLGVTGTDSPENNNRCIQLSDSKDDYTAWTAVANSGQISLTSKKRHASSCAQEKLVVSGDYAGIYDTSSNLYLFGQGASSITYTTNPSCPVTEYNVTYAANGGSGTMTDSNNPYEYRDPFTTLTNTFTRTGYTFTGWTAAMELTTTDNEDTYVAGDLIPAGKTFPMPAGDVELTANWSANTTTITLNKNCASGTDGNATVEYNATELTSITDAVNSATGNHVEGYYTNDATPVKIITSTGTFAGTDISGYISDGKWSYTAASTLTLYAHWEVNTYSVRFNKNNNDATGTMSNQAFTYGTAQNLTANGFSLVGYSFAGWATTSAGEKAYDDEEEVNNLTTTNNDIFDLYAQWTANTHKVSVAEISNVEITATPSGGSAIAEGSYNASVAFGTAITLAHGEVSGGKSWTGWKVTKDADGTDVTALCVSSNTLTMPDYDVTVSANIYGDFVFSCSELTLTAKPATTGTPFFITSTAGKKVRSQDSILIVGSGLTPGQALEFPNLDSKFTVRSRTDGALSVGADGTINAVAYIFYTPGADETTDGLLKITGITVKVGGAKPKQVTLTQDIIGRHLPADFVIAVKRNNKWYALPDTMKVLGTPKPIEIAVNDINNPSLAYTASTTLYGLTGPTAANISGGNGQYIRFTMTSLNADDNPAHGHAPLFGSSTGTAKIGKSNNAQPTSDLSKGYWWKLVQTNTSVNNAYEAKYKIFCANNDTTLSLKENSGDPKWGLYKNGYEELRLIPASDIPYTEASFVEWGQHGGIVEVDAGPTGIDANTVVATLNGTTRTASSFSQTLTSVKGSATKYNYTVNFGDDIDFAAAASNGAMLTLEWKKGDATKAMSNIIVPKIIASSATMSSIMSGDETWRTEVHVLPGVTLTANAGSFSSGDVTIKQLEIYPGATVSVTTGTLDVSTLVLRNGWKRVGEKQFDVARMYIDSEANVTKSNSTDGWYVDWYIDYDQYYSIAVPFPVATNAITYKNTRSAASSGVIIRWYDGQQRASTGQEQIGKNWKAYTWGSDMPTNLNPSRGYAMTAKRPTGKAFSIVRMPLTYSSNKWTEGGEQGYINVDATTYHKDTVTVTGWESSEWYAMGWNFVANPYMSLFNDPDENGINGSLVDQEGKGIRYATIPDVDFKNYEQVNIREASLKPCSGFFVQDSDPTSDTLTFRNSKIVPPASSAPAKFMTVDEALPEQEAYIRLSYDGGKDQMGLIIADEYTAEYEVNADLAKILGEGNFVKTYMHYSNMDMAYVAINATLAKNWIPVTVNIPQAGEYTFSLTNSSIVDELDGVYLIDYGNGNKITNLIERDYVFTATEGTLTDRFAINAIYGERETPTAIDAVEGGLIDSDKPIKFLFHEKVFILYQGIIYDATGKRVNK